MTKILAQLDERSRSGLLELPEAGMGFYIVRAHLRDNKVIEQVCVIGSQPMGLHVLPVGVRPRESTVARVVIFDASLRRLMEVKA
ncbi:MAG: hypothetical protein HYX75_00015 [Acidobacteria bacterium]|nr:hypothetical protein [Acidobacteriota bacterium]